MPRQSTDHDPRWGWYDEILRAQYYDELIPSYEALQARMAASSSLFTICVRGIASLATAACALVRRAGRLPSPRETAGEAATRASARTDRRVPRAHRG